MKIRGLIVVLLSAILMILICLLISIRKENFILKNKFFEVEEKVKQNEIDRENYSNKEKELEELKEKNKDKVLKYEEVEKWNQEIKDYLD